MTVMEVETLKGIAKFFLLLLIASPALAGGVDPREMPEEPVVREAVTASPAETSAAVSKARRAVTPAVEEVQVRPQRPQPARAVRAGRDDWLLSAGSGSCEPLSATSRKVKNMGTFSTPQEFARKLQQRGHQAFVLDIGDVREQVVRVKAPDLNLDVTFMKAGLCR